MGMSSIIKDAFEAGLADPVYHERLIADIQGAVRQAGIPEAFVWTALPKYCGKTEVAYVTQLYEHMNREDPVYGLVYVGKVDGEPINDRMMAIAGACLRNYINAKVMTLQDVLSAMKNNEMPSPTVLLIPNFFLSKKSGGHIADWEISSLISLLYKRQQEQKQTVLYVGDWDGLGSEYGPVFVEHLSGNKFVKVYKDMIEH